MENKAKKMPKYLEIAFDIANRIYTGRYAEGDKLRGRSLLASSYNVSSETIRKAIVQLTHFGVVEVKLSSGIYVKSKSQAESFIGNYKDYAKAKQLYQNIMSLYEENLRIQDTLAKSFREFEQINRFHDPFNIVNIFDIYLKPSTKGLGQSIEALDFWKNTGGTIVAVTSEGQTHTSPGPNYIFKENDILHIAGDVDIENRTRAYLNTPKI
jgi:K+/H+ antiporter YhaU regulatory subunit KhtT